MRRTSSCLLRGAGSLLLVSCLARGATAQVFDYQLQGGNHWGSFGFGLSRIGDVDQDGCEDFIVGAPSNDNGSLPEGMATVYSGKTGTMIVQITGASTTGSSLFGWAVDGKIDADGDGFPDVIITAPLDDSNAPNCGRVLVYSPHLQKALYNLYGSPGAEIGVSLRTLGGDLDGDGVEDFIVGAPAANAAYVYSGAKGVKLFTVTGQPGSGFGITVSGAVNLNGDSSIDFVVGSPFYTDTSGNMVGRITAFSGKNKAKLWTAEGFKDTNFGQGIADLGDVDGDGRTDLVVGAYRDIDTSSVATGSATVLSGSAGSVLYTVYGARDGDDFGIELRSVGGDIDGDGLQDFLVSAPAYDSGAGGYARLYSSAAGRLLFEYTEFTPDPTASPIWYGYGITAADVDGDGRKDVLIGNDYFAEYGSVEAWLTAGASWKNYGTGWPGTVGVPVLTSNQNPIVGAQIDLFLGNSSGINTVSMLGLGVASGSFPTNKGGTLLIVPLLWIPVPLPPTGFTLSSIIPDDPILYGVHGYLQMLEVDAGASKGLSFSQGLDLAFGFP